MFEGPHNPPTPTNDEMTPSASEWHPPTTSTLITTLLSPTRHMFTTTTMSRITGPTYGPIFIHHALIDSPWDPTTTRHLNPTTFEFTPPTNSDPFDMVDDPNQVMFVDITPTNPVPVNPVWRALWVFEWMVLANLWPQIFVFFVPFSLWEVRDSEMWLGWLHLRRGEM